MISHERGSLVRFRSADLCAVAMGFAAHCFRWTFVLENWYCLRRSLGLGKDFCVWDRLDLQHSPGLWKISRLLVCIERKSLQPCRRLL